jgi:hypothetical protein
MSEAKEYVRARNVMHDVDGVEMLEALVPRKCFYLTFPIFSLAVSLLLTAISDRGKRHLKLLMQPLSSASARDQHG